MIWNISSTSKEQKEIGPHLIRTINTIADFGINVRSNKNGGEFCSQANMFDTICRKQVNVFQTCFPCVADKTNQQLTGPQKELLLWHWKLGNNMQHVQELMHDQLYKNEDDINVRLPPRLPIKYTTTKNCSLTMCMPCKLAQKCKPKLQK